MRTTFCGTKMDLKKSGLVNFIPEFFQGETMAAASGVQSRPASCYANHPSRLEVAEKNDKVVEVGFKFFKGQLRTTLSCAMAPRYVQVGLHTPVFDTPFIHDLYKIPLPVDSMNLLRELEVCVLSGTYFAVRRMFDTGICEVSTLEYPSSTPLYVDRRFFATQPDEKLPKGKVFPSSEEILYKLIQSQGQRYIWGGNVFRGISETLKFYPPEQALDAETQAIWTHNGFDCSGLLYFATNGVSPRNTSDLVGWGRPVEIANLTAEQILKKMEPLDLIVWKGHVLIFIGKEGIIESKHPKGVILSDASKRLKEIMETRDPVDSWRQKTPGTRDAFVVRRFVDKPLS